jgi:hypothetical protein
VAGLLLIGAVDAAAARTYVSERFNSPGPRERPTTITQGADAMYTNLGWSSWGWRDCAGEWHVRGPRDLVPYTLRFARLC